MFDATLQLSRQVLEKMWSADIFGVNDKAALPISFAVFLWIAAVDWLSPYELSLYPFYLLLVLLVTWHCSWKWGVIFALLAAANQMAIGVELGDPYSRPMYFFVVNFNKFFSSMVVVGLIASLRVAHDTEKTYARVDFLTEALNNMGFYEALAVEMARHRRIASPFSVVYIDCDNFKEINDRLGHKCGDEFLRQMVRTLKSGLRKTDVVARLGGDEFAVILPETDLETAEKVVSKVRADLAVVMVKNNYTVTFSLGVGVFPVVPASEDIVVRFTDGLMYSAKAAGKNKVNYGVLDAPN